MGHVTITTPLSGTLCRLCAGASNKQCIKFEISKFTHYKDMKGNEKCKKWRGFGIRGRSRSLALILFDRPYMISYLSSIVTMSLYCTLSEILSVIRPLKGQFVIPLLKHHIANQCTKFQVSSFSRSADILGEIKILMGLVTITTPLSGMICRLCARTSYDSAVYQI